MRKYDRKVPQDINNAKKEKQSDRKENRPYKRDRLGSRKENETKLKYLPNIDLLPTRSLMKNKKYI